MASESETTPLLAEGERNEEVGQNAMSEGKFTLFKQVPSCHIEWPRIFSTFTPPKCLPRASAGGTTV